MVALLNVQVAVFRNSATCYFLSFKGVLNVCFETSSPLYVVNHAAHAQLLKLFGDLRAA